MDKKILPYNKMDMDPKVDWDVLVKVLQGTCSEPESQQFGQWLAADAAHAKFFEEMKLLLEVSENKYDTYVPDHAKAWQAIEQQIHAGTPKQQLVTFRQRWYAAAASVLLVLGVALWLYVRPAHEATQYVVQNTEKEAQKLLLPDGSVVWIAPASTITYNHEYNQKMRCLYLKGTAYFEVKPNVRKPFVVSCNQTETKVLGTSFNINALDDTSKVTVSVFSGVVAFKTKYAAAMLHKNELASATLLQGSIDKEKGLQPNVLAWKTGNIIFENAALTEVCSFLSHHYQIHIGIADGAIANKKLTASFHHLPSETVLTIISETLQLHVKKSAQGYLFYQ